MYPELSDALIRRILKSRNQYEGFSQFADLLKTRDITRSAICRSLVRIFLDQKTKAPGHIPYARLLGFQKSSAPLLSQIKKSSSIPLITKAADASAILDKTALRLFNETCAASNLYEMLLCHKTGQPFIHEMKSRCGSFKIHSGFRYNFLHIFRCFEIYLFRQKNTIIVQSLSGSCLKFLKETIHGHVLLLLTTDIQHDIAGVHHQDTVPKINC